MGSEEGEIMLVTAGIGPLLADLPLGQLSAPAILLIVVLLILRGQLVPRKTYEDMKEDRDAWRKAHTVSEEARHVDFAQKSELMEVARTVEHLVGSLPPPKQRGEDS